MKGLGSIKKVNYGLILAALLVGLSACQKSGNSRKTVAQTPVGVAAGCTDCFKQPEFLATTDSEKVNQALYMGLDFYGNLTSGYNFNDPKIPTTYQGPIQAQGRVQIKGIDSMLCNAPIGEYLLRTKVIGQWQMGVATGMKLEGVANNGTRIVIAVIKGVIYNNMTTVGTNKYEINRMGGTFAVEAVNNVACPMAGTIELF